MYVYVLEMCRWADNNNHSYVSTVHSTFLGALNEGLSHMLYRSNKYEPQISCIDVDGSRVHNILCRDGDQARHFYKELTGNEWKEEIEE